MRKLASLDVFLDEEDTVNSSSFEKHGEQCEIILRPNTQSMPWTREEMRPVLAHELGHFLGQLTLAPAHTMGMMGLSLSRLPEENEAWGFAEQIAPDVKDAPIKERALATYKIGQAQQIQRFIEAMLGWTR